MISISATFFFEVIGNQLYIFLDLPIYSSTEIVDKNVERNINTFL